MKNKIKKEFWKKLSSCGFISFTDSVTEEKKNLVNIVEDRDEVIFIHGEFDKYAIEEWFDHTIDRIREDTFNMNILMGIEMAQKAAKRSSYYYIQKLKYEFVKSNLKKIKNKSLSKKLEINY